MIRSLFLFFVLSAVPFSNFAQTTDSTSIFQTVYGKNFSFRVKEPAGWKGDIVHAREFNSNIIFYKSKEEMEKGGALIQVYNFEKLDEQTEKDLEKDIQRYRDKHKKLQEQNLDVTHNTYTCYAKVLFVENEFYQYVVYINPGSQYKTGLSVAMNIVKRPANEDELQAYKAIIASLELTKG